MGNFFWNICTLGGDQVAVQRYLSCPNLSAARKSVWVFAAFNFLVTLALFFCGLSLFAFYANRSAAPVQAFQEEIAARADRVMPIFIVEELPAGVSGLLLAALLAAAMSSLSSGINSISGVVVSDFFQRFNLFKAHVQSLWADKVVSLLAGLVGIATSISTALLAQRTDWNLVELTGRLNHIFVGPLGVLFFAGILFRRAGKQAALLGFLLGTLTSLFICFGREWFGLEKSLSFVWVVPLPFLVGLALAGLLAYLFPRPPKTSVQGLTLVEVRAADRTDS
jgi:SSS family solute:Na+ symporter